MLKREARILGLSGTTVRDKRIIVSMAFRGSLWLDGVVSTWIDASDRDYTLTLSKLVRRSKQFSQLHAIIISHRLVRTREISIRELARKVKLPVIAIGTIKQPGIRGANHFEIIVAGKHVRVSTVGVERETAANLYRIGCRHPENIPEVVRVADLLAEQLSRL